MALTDEGGTPNMVMPVSPYNGGYGNDGFGFGNNGFWIILLFLLLGGWGGGFGGYGGNNLASDAAVMYPWMNQQSQISSGFRDQMVSSKLDSIQTGINSGFGDVQLGLAGINQNICSTGNGIVSAVTGAQNALTQQMYANQLADLERSFAAQTATTAGMSGLQSQLASCCCENRAGLADLRYTVATEACADRNAVSSALRDVLTATQAQTQTILDKMCQQEIDNLKAQNIALQNQVNMQALAASQAAQTAALVADNSAQTQYIVNRVAPYPSPAYIVNNPVSPVTPTTVTA